MMKISDRFPSSSIDSKTPLRKRERTLGYLHAAYEDIKHCGEVSAASLLLHSWVDFKQFHTSKFYTGNRALLL